MTDFDNTNRGALFKNKDKDAAHPNWADYQGSINVDGVEFWLSAWLKKGKKSGVNYMSLSVTKKEAFVQKNTQARAEYMQQAGEAVPDDFDDDIPF